MFFDFKKNSKKQKISQNNQIENDRTSPGLTCQKLVESETTNLISLDLASIRKAWKMVINKRQQKYKGYLNLLMAMLRRRVFGHCDSLERMWPVQSTSESVAMPQSKHLF